MHDLLATKPVQVDDLATLPANTEGVWVIAKTRSQERLLEFPKLKRLIIWSVNEAMLEKVAELNGLEFLMLGGKIVKLPKKFRLPRLHSLVLRDMPNLTSLNGLESLTNLRALRITGMKSLTDYRPVGRLKRLERLELGREQYYERPTIDSLKWIESLTGLQDVSISFNKLKDDSGKELAKLKKLKTLFISGSIFPRPTLAYLAGKLSHLQSDCLVSYANLEGSLCLCPKCKSANLVVMRGKGCGLICPKCKAAKFTKLHEEFLATMEQAKSERD